MPLLDFNEFKWRVMTAAITQIKPAPRFLQDMVFKTRNAHGSDHIDVDMIIGGTYVAPFVSPVEGGTIVAKMGRNMKSVIAPRIRLKKPFTAQELLTTRGVGQGFYTSGGSGDITGYRQRKIGEELNELRTRIDTTVEWMCAQALTGSLTVSQDNLVFAVDYNIPAAHKPTCSTKWDATGGDPMTDIDTWANLIINAIGIGPDIMICGKNVVKALRDHTAIQSLLDNRRIETGQFTWKATSNYMGNLNGIDLYRYGSTYIDANGAEQKFIADDAVILIATGARFSIEYGNILDLEADANIIGQYFSKSWMEKDPSNLWILAESRPLPVPWQPEAIVYCSDVVA